MIDFNELIKPTLEILEESGKSMYIKDIDAKLAQKMKISGKDLQEKHKDSKQTEFSYRAAWARTYLKKYGVLHNPERGFWEISDTYGGEGIDADKVVSAVRNNQKYTPTEKETDIYINEENSAKDIDRENKKYIAELREKYRNHKVSLFLGAGVSIAANMPSWDELITEFLLQRLEDENAYGYDRDLKQELEKLAKVNGENSPLMQIRFIKQNIKPEKYQELLTNALYNNSFCKGEKDIDNALFEALVNLIRHKNIIYIRDIITFNFDNLLEKKLKQRGIFYKSYDGGLVEREESSVNIYHVHGCLNRDPDLEKLDMDNVVFSEEQYHNMYKDIYNWSNIKQIDILQENTCLFVGCSLSDPNTRRLLDIAYKEGETRHYAIMKKEEIKLPEGMTKESSAYRLYQNFHINHRN